MIGFLQPLALLALVAAGIPALLHLLGRRLPPTFMFPAVRYLTATEREHSRRLRFRNLLLLVLRTAALVFLVLAAARPVLQAGSGGAHQPTALALIVDNSPSSGAVVEGRRVLDAIVETARNVVSNTGVSDRLWLVLADGVPLRKTRLEVLDELNDLNPSTVRLDLGEAVRAAALAIEDDPLPDGPVVIVSDLQESALTRGDIPGIRVLAWEPPSPPPNRWLDSVRSQPAIWTPSGAVVAAVDGTLDRPATLRLRAGEVEIARAVATAGDRVVLSGTLPATGWSTASVELDPDEMRSDDRRVLALFRAEPAAVTSSGDAGRFLEEALTVLQEGGRVLPGPQVFLGGVSQAGVSVVFPPADPALVGALNRALSARGAQWQFGEVVQGEWQLSDVSGTADGMEVFWRYRLVGAGDVFATVTGEPWLVRSADVVIVASRMLPDWTRLPVSASFVPFMDFLVNRIAAVENWIIAGSPGDVVALPPGASTVHGESPNDVTNVPGDRRLVAPRRPGVYFLRSASGDTVGALEVNTDPRESRLQVADESQLRAAFGRDAQILESGALLSGLFGAVGQVGLTGIFLLATAIAVLGELLVASAGGQSRKAV